MKLFFHYQLLDVLLCTMPRRLYVLMPAATLIVFACREFESVEFIGLQVLSLLDTVHCPYNDDLRSYDNTMTSAHMAMTLMTSVHITIIYIVSGATICC